MEVPSFLTDEDWWAENGSVAMKVLAERFGCTKREMGFLKAGGKSYYRNRYSPVEWDIVCHFYGRTPAVFIAQALGRDTSGVRRFAWRHGLTGQKGRSIPRRYARANPDVFWRQYRSYVRQNWSRWIQDDHEEALLALTWRAGFDPESCYTCEHLDHCRANGDKLKCERVTIGEWLMERRME